MDGGSEHTRAIQKTEMHSEAVIMANLIPLGYSGSSEDRFNAFASSSGVSPAWIPSCDALLDIGEAANTSFFSPSAKGASLLQLVSVATVDEDTPRFDEAGFVRESVGNFMPSDAMSLISV
jgi:hypothetical protein